MIVRCKRLYNKYHKKIMATLLKWSESNKISSDHISLEVKQVYGWIITKDEHLVLVSKDNIKWQFPGGKPNMGENLLQTLTREVYEETSLNISNMKKEFFGYYEISSQGKPSFLQIRYLIICDKNSKELKLDISNEDEIQLGEDIVKYVNSFNIKDALKLIPWLGESEEYKSFLKIYKNVRKRAQ